MTLTSWQLALLPSLAWTWANYLGATLGTAFLRGARWCSWKRSSCLVEPSQLSWAFLKVPSNAAGTWYTRAWRYTWYIWFSGWKPALIHQYWQIAYLCICLVFCNFCPASTSIVLQCSLRSQSRPELSRRIHYWVLDSQWEPTEECLSLGSLTWACHPCDRWPTL